MREPRPERPYGVDHSGGLTARAVGKTYKGRPVVRNVSVTLHRGEAVGLLGP
ncbi:MAG: ABC transporter ATP-binding protein, partial [Rhodospirillales bacterium 20-64-7]